MGPKLLSQRSAIVISQTRGVAPSWTSLRLQAASIVYIQSVINAGVGPLCREKKQTAQWSSQQGALSWNEVFTFKLLIPVICVYRYQTDFTERTRVSADSTGSEHFLQQQVCECVLLPAEGGLRGALSQSIDHGAVAGDPLPLISGSETNTALFLFLPPMIDF